VKYNSWEKKRRIEQDYANSMSKLTNFFFSKAVKGMDELEHIQSKLHSAAADPLFKQWAQALSKKMVTGLQVESVRTWREAASEGSRGKAIFQQLQNELHNVTGARVNQLIRQNAELISSLPLEVSQRLAAAIQKAQAEGKRFKGMDIGKYVTKLTKTRIALIARTETSKASTALTRSRSEDLGLDWYIWRTSKDGRVRDSHRHMDGVLCSWSDAPNPEALKGIRSKLGAYHAGDAPNDRCYPEPVVGIDLLRFPMKVHVSGSIKYMTRHNFEIMSGMRRVA
jgi:SPP1 gp7 family putative phage head morphogenesis protein